MKSYCLVYTEPVVRDNDNLRWKMTFTGRQPYVEDDLPWKTTFGGRLPLVEDHLQWKTTFRGR